MPQDHEMGNLKIFDVMRRTVSKVTTLDFNRANFRQLSELVTSVLFHEYWSVFKNHLLKAQEQVISLCRKSNKPCRRPA